MAQRYESLKEVLFAEIKNRVYEWHMESCFTFKENPVRAYCSNGAVAYGGSYDNPDMCRGLTDINLLVCDELALAPPDLFSVLAPCLRGPRVVSPRIVGATTPRKGSLWNLRFAEAAEMGWEIITGSTFDNTKLSEESLKLITDSVDTEEMRRQELYGELLIGNDATRIIHLNEFPASPAPTTDQSVIAGLDCGEGVERDCTAFVKRQGNRIIEAWKLNNIDHEETVRRIRESNKHLHIDELKLDAAFSDYEYNILKYEIPCEQVNFARAATEENKDKYANVRAEMYFNLAWHIKHGLCVEGFELSPELKRQLCAIGWWRNNQGRLLLTKKEDLRAALKMSPDIADALALTCLRKYELDDPQMQQHTEQDRAKIRQWARTLMG